jgi:hypothetical protein
MRPIRLCFALVLLGLAACSTTGTGDSSTLLIDQPNGPYPYNSRFCP